MTIGKVWAVCDHFEKETGQPVTMTTLKQATGYDRTQFRKWVRDGRLIEHHLTSTNGQALIGYTRPKAEQ